MPLTSIPAGWETWHELWEAQLLAAQRDAQLHPLFPFPKPQSLGAVKFSPHFYLLLSWVFICPHQSAGFCALSVPKPRLYQCKYLGWSMSWSMMLGKT